MKPFRVKFHEDQQIQIIRVISPAWIDIFNILERMQGIKPEMILSIELEVQDKT